MKKSIGITEEETIKEVRKEYFSEHSRFIRKRIKELFEKCYKGMNLNEFNEVCFELDSIITAKIICGNYDKTMINVYLFKALVNLGYSVDLLKQAKYKHNNKTVSSFNFKEYENEFYNAVYELENETEDENVFCIAYCEEILIKILSKKGFQMKERKEYVQNELNMNYDAFLTAYKRYVDCISKRNKAK